MRSNFFKIQMSSKLHCSYMKIYGYHFWRGIVKPRQWIWSIFPPLIFTGSGMYTCFPLLTMTRTASKHHSPGSSITNLTLWRKCQKSVKKQRSFGNNVIPKTHLIFWMILHSVQSIKIFLKTSMCQHFGMMF